jgi:outer membrane lipoprotein LolB
MGSRLAHRGLPGLARPPGLAHRGLPGLAGLLAVAVIAGCRTAPVQHAPAVSQPWDATRAELQARDHFSFKGKIGVAAGKDGFNASLRWAQAGTRSNVSLEGPLGVGGVQINLDGDTLEVVNSHGDHLDSDAARAELAARLGFEPPLKSLRYWVLGVPDPTLPATESVDSEQQRLQSLEQEGWQIDYGAYAPTDITPVGSAGGLALPQKMTVQRPGVRVRLIVDGWSP